MGYVVNTDLTRVPAGQTLSPRAQGGRCLFRPAGEMPPADDEPLHVVYPRASDGPERWTRIY